MTLPAAKNYVGYDFTAISPDGTKLYIDGIDKLFVYDTSDNTRVKAISVTGSRGVPAATPDGKYLYVPIYSTIPSTIVMIATARNKIIGQPITVGNGAGRIAIAPDGDYAYVTNGMRLGAQSWATTKTFANLIEIGGIRRIPYHGLLPLKQNALDRTRTCDPGIRNPLLYPAELRAQIVILVVFSTVILYSRRSCLA